jgi:hypothetical protein
MRPNLSEGGVMTNHDVIARTQLLLSAAKSRYVEANRLPLQIKNEIESLELILSEVEGKNESKQYVIQGELSKKQADHLLVALNDLFEDETFEIIKVGKKYSIIAHNVNMEADAFANGYSYGAGIWSY